MDFTPDLRYFRLGFKDYRNFRECRDFGNCRDFRDYRDYRDYRRDSGGSSHLGSYIDTAYDDTYMYPQNR